MAVGLCLRVPMIMFDQLQQTMHRPLGVQVLGRSPGLFFEEKFAVE